MSKNLDLLHWINGSCWSDTSQEIGTIWLGSGAKNAVLSKRPPQRHKTLDIFLLLKEDPSGGTLLRGAKTYLWLGTDRHYKLFP
jgi:hypothetical protein